MSVPAESNHKRHTILLDGEYRRGEVTASREVIDPAIENVIAASFDPER